MSYESAVQPSRYELKYIVDENRALAIRDFVRGYLEPDQYALGNPDCSYLISSLYLDSRSLVLYRGTVTGLKNRFKLRIRFYDDDQAHPAFLEIKRRINEVICKERAAMEREAVLRFLKGRRPGPSDLILSNGNRKAEAALEHFCDLREGIDAVPTAFVTYVREAYVSADSDHLRVTFDRQLRGSMFDERAGLTVPRAGAYPRMGGVVLELKFMDRFPHWMGELTRIFGLQRRSVAKYVNCVEALGLRPARWFQAARESVA